MTISRRTHGFLDYIVGVLLILSPRLFNFDHGGIESQLPIFLGVAALVYSVLTRYELGLFRVIPFKVHLALDTVSGIVLALSPWLFGFADRVWVPHLILGLVELGAVMMTRRTAADEHHGLPGRPATM